MQQIHLHFPSGCSSQDLSRIRTLLTNLNERQETLMTVVQLANQKLDQLKGSIENMKDRVQTDIDYLKSRINSGEQVTTGDLEALEAKFNSLISNVDQVDPIPEVPTPEPDANPVKPTPEPGIVENNPVAVEQPVT